MDCASCFSGRGILEFGFLWDLSLWMRMSWSDLHFAGRISYWFALGLWHIYDFPFAGVWSNSPKRNEHFKSVARVPTATMKCVKYSLPSLDGLPSSGISEVINARRWASDQNYGSNYFQELKERGSEGGRIFNFAKDGDKLKQHKFCQVKGIVSHKTS